MSLALRAAAAIACAAVLAAGCDRLVGSRSPFKAIDVTGALPVYAALLTAQGKVLFDFLVWPGADGAPNASSRITL